jgi:ADP-ribose pyrophosphatase YjhB (NUDIX family)
MIRPHTQIIIKHEDKIFVHEMKDKVSGETFYRAPGGGIEFGETSLEALHREVKEEFNTTVKTINFLGAIENIFEHELQKGHEIIFFYSAKFSETKMFEEKVHKVLDSETSYAIWKPVDNFISKKEIFYPKEAIEYLQS